MKRAWVVALSLLVVLTSCTAVPASTPTPTSVTSPNEAACSEFAAATDRFATLIVKAFSSTGLTDAEDTELSEFGATFDSVALQGDGEVGDRIEIVAELVLDKGVIIGMSPDTYFDAIDAVERACSAEGFDVALTKWS